MAARLVVSDGAVAHAMQIWLKLAWLYPATWGRQVDGHVRVH